MDTADGTAPPSPPRRATSADVARRANVSRTTVSFILNGKVDQRISSATRRSVLAAARQLDYRPNRSARELATGTTSTLVCFVPASRLGEGALRLVGELTAALSRAGYSLAVYFESSDRKALATLVQVLQPRLVFPLYGGLPTWVDDELLGGTTALRGPGAGFTGADPGARAQAEHLVERGHRRLAYVGLDDRSMGALDEGRRTAIAAVCQERGLPAPVTVDVRATGEDAGRVLTVLRGAGVTGACCFNDEIAFMVLNVVHAAGLRCPDDLAVVGYDAIPLSAWSVPPLSTVAWDARGAAAVFAAGLVSAADPLHLPAGEHVVEGLVAAHVVVRQSS